MLCVCVCVLLGKQSLAPFYYQWSITKSIYKQPYLLTGTRVAQERLTPTAVNSLHTKLPSLSYLSDRERWDGVERERGGWGLNFICPLKCMCIHVHDYVRVKILLWWRKCKEVYADGERERGREEGRKSEQEWRMGWRGGEWVSTCHFWNWVLITDNLFS